MNSIPAIPSEIHAPILHLGLGALDVRLSPIAITVGPAAENIVEQARTAWLASSAAVTGRAPDALGRCRVRQHRASVARERDQREAAAARYMSSRWRSGR